MNRLLYSYVVAMVLIAASPEMSIARAKKEVNAKTNGAQSEQASQVEVSEGAEKKSWWSRFTSRKTLNTMNYQELKETKNKYLAEKNTVSAIKFLEKMVKECTDLNERRTVMLELADLLFETEKFNDAGVMYKEFIKYYSGSDKVEYASYREIICSYKQIIETDRDQSKTVETVELAQNFLDRSEIFTTYSPEVNTMINTCYERLFENEMKIADFYVNRGRYTSANKRLETVREKFVTLLPVAEPQILLCECNLAEKTKNTELLITKQAELSKKFPTFNSVVMAQNTGKKTRSFMNRF